MDKVAEAIKSFVESAIGVDPIEMLVQVLATLLLFLVVRYFFWNNITAYLDGRKEAMGKEYEDAKNANEAAQSLKEQASTELHDIRLNAKSIVDDAKTRGEEERQGIVNNAKGEAKKVLENAQKEIDSEIEKARSDINNEIVSVATLMAEKVINKKLTKNEQENLVEEVSKGVVN